MICSLRAARTSISAASRSERFSTLANSRGVRLTIGLTFFIEQFLQTLAAEDDLGLRCLSRLLPKRVKDQHAARRTGEIKGPVRAAGVLHAQLFDTSADGSNR